MSEKAPEPFNTTTPTDIAWGVAGFAAASTGTAILVHTYNRPADAIDGMIGKTEHKLDTLRAMRADAALVVHSDRPAVQRFLDGQIITQHNQVVELYAEKPKQIGTTEAVGVAGGLALFAAVIASGVSSIVRHQLYNRRLQADEQQQKPPVAEQTPKQKKTESDIDQQVAAYRRQLEKLPNATGPND